MDFATFYNTLLQHATFLLVVVNETVLCFDHWIYTPSTPPIKHAWPSNYFAHPAVSTLIYAFSLPLFYKAMLWLSMPPLSYLIPSMSMHVSMSGIALQSLWRAAIEERLTEPLAYKGDDVTTSQTAEDGSKNVMSLLDRLTAVYSHPLTAAMKNAAVLIFAQGLHARSLATTTWGTVMEQFFNSLGALACFGQIYMMHNFGVQTHRPHFFRTLKLDRHSLLQGSYLVLLLVLCLVVRWSLGLEILPLLSISDKERANKIYSVQSFEWMESILDGLPMWVRFVPLVVMLVLQALGAWQWRREIRRSDEKLERLAAARLESGGAKLALE